MNEMQRLPRRLEAYRLGRAVLTREAADLAPDTAITLGIATIKVVTEEQVQALAFGDFDDPPRIIARIDPLGRDASDLEPFAAWLAERLDTALRMETMPRVWLPHEATLETLDVLGYRYERNVNATPSLQRMGQLCRILAREVRHSGQQSIAVASTSLLAHVATGQSPAEDAHLGALLAWLSPPAVGSARDLARARSIEPASGILSNYPGRRDDEQVENLRREWKRSTGARRMRVEEAIRAILERAARDEWALLRDARAAFHALPLRPGALDDCVRESRDRLMRSLSNGPRVPRNAIPRIRELAALENSQSLLSAAQLAGDAVVRSEAHRKGRGLVASVTNVVQRRANYKPCRVTLASPQRALKLRPDDKVDLVGTSVVGKVLAVDFDPATGGSTVTLDILEGVRSVQGSLRLGLEAEFVRHESFPLYMRTKNLNGLVAPWMLDAAAAAPAAVPKNGIGGDLLAVAARHLGGRS